MKPTSKAEAKIDYDELNEDGDPIYNDHDEEIDYEEDDKGRRVYDDDNLEIDYDDEEEEDNDRPSHLPKIPRPPKPWT